jgi:drug/metabolite transporter (DMT)-like permease
MALSALAFSAMNVLVKQLGTRLPTQEIVFVLGVGVLAQLGQVWLTRGLASESAGRATALSYLQIAFAVLWGWLFFAELPGPWTGAGATLIAAGTWIGARAAARARAQ